MGTRGLVIVACAMAARVAVAGVLASAPSASPAPPNTSLSDFSPGNIYALDAPVVGAIQPVPRIVNLDPERVALGDRLIHEERLSSDGDISRASCHDLSVGGDDGLARSVGVKGAVGTANAPTVFNFRQFWDGRARNLHDQIDGPRLAEHEMDGAWEHVVGFLEDDVSYRADFDQAYGGVVSDETVKDALVSFECRLTTPDAPFDRYLRGETTALNPEQLEGYELFLDLGCVTYHQGVNLGGNMFQKFGHMRPFATKAGDDPKIPAGRFAVTGREADRQRFKVPTLRNVALTAPDLHDGSVDDLGRTVELMAYHELGLELAAGDTRRLVAFLESLTGQLPPR